jgi:toxin-antitoxin system PIN domain toxin
MTFLLDVNLLFVLHQPHHPDWMPAKRWFLSHSRSAFATCPITQSGLVRLLMQRVGGLEIFLAHEARAALECFVERPGHLYWPDDPAYLDATRDIFPRIQGHRQITDAYLLGLAVHHHAKLATLDKGILHLAGAEFGRNVEIIA